MTSPINHQLERTRAALSKNIATKAGRTISEPDIAAESPQQKQALIDAISQLFAELELVYHNQYIKAFGSNEKLSYAKRLWFSHLKSYDADTIIKAVKVATRESEYLPSVYTMLSACDRVLGDQGIPSPAKAYREACLAPSPKAEHRWSHAIVYLAGKDCGWQFLHETSERYALPVFTEHFQRWRAKYLSGEQLSLPALPHVADTQSKPKQSKESKIETLKQLRDKFDL